MTNIVVAVKYVPDATADRKFNADNTVDREGVDGLLSELDEYAVEQALQIIEAGEGEVTVLTVGPAGSELREETQAKQSGQQGPYTQLSAAQIHVTRQLHSKKCTLLRMQMRLRMACRVGLSVRLDAALYRGDRL